LHFDPGFVDELHHNIENEKPRLQRAGLNRTRVDESASRVLTAARSRSQFGDSERP
jgi:hypothetical protein